MQNTVTFLEASLSEIGLKQKNGAIVSKIKFITRFTPAAARALDAKSLMFDKEDFPKEGYKEIRLDYVMPHVHIKLTPDKMAQHTLELDSESATDFKVIKTGGKKKGKATLALSFCVSHAGSPYPALEYWLSIGGAPGALELTSKQSEMFAPEEKKKRGRPKKEAVQEVIPEVVADKPVTETVQ